MDRNTIAGFLLIAVILIGWSYFSAPDKESIEAMQLKQDSLKRVEEINDSLALIEINNISDSVSSNIASSDTSTQAVTESIFISDTIEKKEICLENENIRVIISNQGAKIKSVELLNYKKHNGDPLLIMDSDSNNFNFGFFADNKLINTSDINFDMLLNGDTNIPDSIKINGNDSILLSFRTYPVKSSNDSTLNKDAYLELQYTFSGNTYEVGLKLNFVGLQNVIAASTSYINFDWSNEAPSLEKSIDNERNASTIYYKFLADDVENLSERKDGKESLNNKLKWIALKQQFFSTVVVAQENFMNAEVETITNKERLDIVKNLKTSIGIPYENKMDYVFNMKFYFLPNHFNTLKSYDLSFEEIVPLGWGIFSWINRFAVIPVFNFLNGFNLNYGLIILILTILIKILLFPIAYKTYSSSAKMRILKPDIEEINAKFPKKEDALKKQQATMALYKKAGVNPMAGCLPMLLQMPILIAMFRFFPASIELRQEAFLWAEDLSTYDSILDLSFNIPFYGSHVSLFTLLMTISTIIYTKINQDMMGSTNQMPGMKVMMYMMPIMFLGMFNSFPAALSYYYFLTNIITFLQMFIFRFIIDEEKLKIKIEANKARKITVKKSGFQKRLEEMAKNRGYKPPKK
ncbi:MAG: membrane protein insertase YidC [Bacteroidales bacterium]|nr:membrane protein insertase YidC [Bacteroidales bacterium]